MNPVEQAKQIADVVGLEVQTKYAKGQREHGGDFFAKPTVDNIREEVLDLIAYTHVLDVHKQELKENLQALALNIKDESCPRDKLSTDVEKIMQMVHNL